MSKASSTKPNEFKRRMRLLALNVEVEPLLKQAIGTRDFGIPSLISHWSDIAGSEIARHSIPLSLRFGRGMKHEGTLKIRCRGSFALELQHSQIEMLARINTYFGYKAVARILIEQGPVPMPRQNRPKKRMLSTSEKDGLDRILSSVLDSSLKNRLERLGQALLRAKKPS